MADRAAPRKQSRTARRQQLVDATIAVLAEKGYARITMADVAGKAGLATGLVNFHFETKEKLLTETLLFLAEEYRQNWTAAVDAAPLDSPAHQLDALLRADFAPAICTAERLSAWCSFWGEAQAKPLYQAHCASNDARYFAVLTDLCRRLTAAGGYSHDPASVARVLRVTGEGIWLDLMTMSSPYERDEGCRTVMTCAAAFFPRHFTAEGAIA